LANGELILAIPPISQFPIGSLSQGKRQKRGRNMGGKVRRAKTEKLEEK
jgi:hypothetical protein